MESPKIFANDGPRHVQLWFLRATGLESRYFRGYRTAAESLIEGATKDPLLFFPAAFCYRHYIELHLKYLLHCLRELKLVEPAKDKKTDHYLDSLWPKVKEGLLKRWPPTGPDPKLDRAESIVMEFHEIDPTGQETRFGTRNDEVQSLGNLPSELNFSGTREKMTELYEVLDSCTEIFEEELRQRLLMLPRPESEEWEDAA